MLIDQKQGREGGKRVICGQHCLCLNLMVFDVAISRYTHTHTHLALVKLEGEFIDKLKLIDELETKTRLKQRE